jgi:hypothetical protein
MIQIIRLEAQHIENPQNQIPNQSNIEGWSWEKKFNYTKGSHTKNTN